MFHSLQHIISHFLIFKNHFSWIYFFPYSFGQIWVVYKFSSLMTFTSDQVGKSRFFNGYIFFSDIGKEIVCSLNYVCLLRFSTFFPLFNYFLFHQPIVRIVLLTFLPLFLPPKLCFLRLELQSVWTSGYFCLYHWLSKKKRETVLSHMAHCTMWGNIFGLATLGEGVAGAEFSY